MLGSWRLLYFNIQKKKNPLSGRIRKGVGESGKCSNQYTLHGVAPEKLYLMVSNKPLFATKSRPFHCIYPVMPR